MKGIEHLHPKVQELARLFLDKCKDAMLPVKISDTLRTEAEQNAIPAGNTNAKFPLSYHNWGLAFDFYRDVKGKEWETGDGFFDKCGAIGKSIGLFWGGDFKTLKGDLGHLEYQGFGTVKELAERWGTPELFLGSW
jgi:peptidoglycan LD-endopeptidase CwlK